MWTILMYTIFRCFLKRENSWNLENSFAPENNKNNGTSIIKSMKQGSPTQKTARTDSEVSGYREWTTLGNPETNMQTNLRTISNKQRKIYFFFQKISPTFQFFFEFCEIFTASYFTISYCVIQGVSENQSSH